ncbi:MAG: hypothetical protein E4H01_15780 [Lysobacterales bacterium]|nr:MAG: hypothetical protein E4H01_15780 [Xanthomonadales bacterium]
MKTESYRYKAGVTVRNTHELPHIAKIRDVAVATAPDTADGIMWITEAWRPPRHHDDAHTWCCAFDLRIHNILKEHREAKILEGIEWIKRMRLVHIGDKRYQFELHGDGDNVHIHSEFDPR